MSDEVPLLALYKLSAQFRPEIERLGGRLLKVVIEWEGRSITYNHDEREFPNPPEPERVMSVPPPLPVSAPASPPPPSPVAIAPAPTSAQMVVVDGYELPIPPIAKVDKTPSKRTDPIDGITPLTDEDICPIGKKYPNTKLQDIPADYLDWLYGQPWLKKNQPRLWAYIARHEDVITQDLKRSGRA